VAAEGLVAFGEHALRFPLDERAERRALLASLRDVAGATDVVLAEDTGAVVLREGSSLDDAKEAVGRALAKAAPRDDHTAPSAHHVIRVVYDGEDLAEIAAATGMGPGEVVALHAGGDYEVAMLGFLPGFAYLRGLDPRLVLPRRAQPRTRVPAGSVAIAAEYTGIYPLASPGGWNLLGHALGHPLFDARGAALAVGDRVRFERADVGEAGAARPEAAAEQPAPPHGVFLEVMKAHGPALVVDGGRIGHMHEGVPHGGAMVPAALARANAAAGNPAGAAAIELYGSLEVVARGGSVTVADDVRGATTLAEGDPFTLATEGRTRVRYLALSGGVDVPVVLGGRGTLLVARLGGYAGRPLERGDRLASAGAPCSSPVAVPLPSARPGAIEILGGPDADDDALDAITRATFTISARSDRIGTRLDGPTLPPHRMQGAHNRRSRPMIRGAIEMTPSGLVVLGPDHPTTGGYPVVAVVAECAFGDLMGLPIGAPVRLTVTL
jgi:KipI family sensor histidine kinase inhibitor